MGSDAVNGLNNHNGRHHQHDHQPSQSVNVLSRTYSLRRGSDDGRNRAPHALERMFVKVINKSRIIWKSRLV